MSLPISQILAVLQATAQAKGLGTTSNVSYNGPYFNRPGTKLVRRFYGEEAARRWNRRYPHA